MGIDGERMIAVLADDGLKVLVTTRQVLRVAAEQKEKRALIVPRVEVGDSLFGPVERTAYTQHQGIGDDLRAIERVVDCAQLVEADLVEVEPLLAITYVGAGVDRRILRIQDDRFGLDALLSERPVRHGLAIRQLYGELYEA